MSFPKSIIFSALLFGTVFNNATAQSVWTARGSGTTRNLWGVAYAPGQILAVGDSGTLLTSPDGITWTPSVSGTTNTLRSAVWTGSQWVVVGGRTILTSPDGITWTSQTPVSNTILYSVTWTGTQLVAVGSAAPGVYSGVYTSPDGITWTSQILGGASLYTLRSVIWTGSTLVAVGGTTPSVAATSTDGITWTRTTPSSGGAAGLFSVASTDSQFVAAGTSAILTSPDGLTWTSQASLANLFTVIWTGQQLVAAGASGKVYASPNGVTWTNQSSGTTNTFNSLVWTGDLLVGVTSNGGILTSPQDPPLTIPVPPTLSTPIQNGVGVSTPTNLSWSPSAGATSYRVQLSTDSTFATSLINDSSVTTNLRTTGTLSFNTTYYWRVNAKNAAGTSAFSDTWKFTTVNLSPPAAPNLNSPAQNATGISIFPTLSWLSSTNATGYHLQVSTNSDFTMLVMDDTALTGTSRPNVGGLSYNTVYYWRVSARNAAGISAYSEIRNFTTAVLVAPTFPVLTSPAQNATGVPVSANLTWNAVAGAATYRLQISTNSGFTSTVVDDSTLTTASVVEPLANNTTYYWRVNAKNAVGTSAYSSIWSFSTVPGVPAPPTLLSPSNGGIYGGSFSSLPSFSWNASAGAISYHLQISTDSTFATTVIDSSSISTTITKISLAYDMIFYWRVSASNSSGTSVYSPVWRFGLLAPPFEEILPMKSIIQHLSFGNGSFLRFDVPNSMIGSNTSASIYSLTGNKMVEVHSSRFDKEVALPLGNLPRGIYLLKLQGQGKSVEQSFSLTR